MLVPANCMNHWFIFLCGSMTAFIKRLQLPDLSRKKSIEQKPEVSSVDDNASESENQDETV